MARLILLINYLLATLVIAAIAILAYYDFKYFQPALKNYNLNVTLPESLPKLIDVDSGDRLPYKVANILLDDANYQKGHLNSYLWGNYVSLHLTKGEQHAVFASRVYFGKQVYGFEQASKLFYAKDLLDITLQEAALLVVRSWSPLYANQYPEKTKKRAQDLLSKAGYDV